MEDAQTEQHLMERVRLSTQKHNGKKLSAVIKIDYMFKKIISIKKFYFNNIIISLFYCAILNMYTQGGAKSMSMVIV